MMTDEILVQTTENALRKQALILKGTAIVTGLTGAGLLVGSVYTVLDPREQLSVKVTMFVISALMLAGGAFLWFYLTKHFQRRRSLILELILERPRDIASMKIFELRQGVVTTRAVHITDKAGTLIGIMVPSEKAAIDLMQRIEARRA